MQARRWSHRAGGDGPYAAEQARENVSDAEENLPAAQAALAAKIRAEATTGTLAEYPNSEKAIYFRESADAFVRRCRLTLR